MTKVDPKHYCGIVFIGGGSSWCYAPTIDGAAQKAARQCRADWSSLFKFEKKQPFTVNVYDMTEHSGWHASAEGVFAQGTNIRLTPAAKVVVKLTCR